MIKTLTLLDVAIYDKSKDGKTLTYTDKKSGELKRYKKIRISVQEMEDKLWGAIWDSKSPMNNWERDMKVTVDVEQDAQGYWHFKIPNKDSELKERIDKLEARVSKLEKDVYDEEPSPIKAGYNEKELDPMEVAEPSEEEFKPEDLPF